MPTTTSHWTPVQISDQTGRTAFITGGNSGIGYETARVLAGKGARLILAGRDAARLDEASARLRAETGAQVSTAVINLGSLASIADATAALADETIDLLLNNAGVMNIPTRRTTRDGFELTFGTNHLGHFALTAGLFPAIRRSQAARIVTVSAIAGTWRSGRLNDLMSDHRYTAMGAYAKSKRANIVFTEELARRTAGSNIEAMVVHPGSAVTNLQRHSTGALSRIVIALMRNVVMGSPEGAAWPSLWAATSPDARSGGFYGPAGHDQTSGTPKPVRLPADATDPAEGARLWQDSERYTGIRFTI
ncbi:oxidoreductase [Polymorphospora sp. NPDC050346]|uniref:oxidoreductase n=1 Tax=Polymorphospora sp. NPDC050346 TaxID=3155780 RepID=UPI003408F450